MKRTATSSACVWRFSSSTAGMSSSSHFRFFFPPLKVTSLHWQQQSPFINIVDLALFTASARRSRTGRSTRRPSPAAEWQRTCSPRIVETALLRPGRTSTLLLSAQRGNWVLLSSLLQHLGSFVPKKNRTSCTATRPVTTSTSTATTFAKKPRESKTRPTSSSSARPTLKSPFSTPYVHHLIRYFYVI